MKRFEALRRHLGLSIGQAARIWEVGVDSPEAFVRALEDAAGQERCAALLQIGPDRIPGIAAEARRFLDTDRGWQAEESSRQAP